ncbi:MAG: helix-turn-helix domain-containing protein [Rhizobium sp.]|nr:helix-turn-helix domain-containing protein [Rhizobium sp.]MDM8015814.1 helix-turn-helix domain-containing protein [Rhizobium sp.]
MKKIFEPSIARAARAYTRLGHIELAEKAGVTSRTVYKLEKDGRVTPASLDKIMKVLRVNGVTLILDESTNEVCGLKFTKVEGLN